MITNLNLIFTMVYEPYRRSLEELQSPFDKHENWRKQAKLLKLSKPAIQRLEWFILYETTAERNASLVYRHFAIPGKTFHKWRNRFDKKNLRTLEDQNRAPKHTRQKEITGTEESRIIALRKDHMVWGKMKLARLYRDEHKAPISS